MIKKDSIFIVRFLMWVLVVNALWPTMLALASPTKDERYMLICSSFGYQYVALGEDGMPKPADDEVQSQPCPFCSSVDLPPLIGAFSSMLPEYGKEVLPYSKDAALFVNQYWRSYISRAPPYGLFV